MQLTESYFPLLLFFQIGRVATLVPDEEVNFIIIFMYIKTVITK